MTQHDHAPVGVDLPAVQVIYTNIKSPAYFHSSRVLVVVS
jgi:hypothetical protein